MMVEIIGKRYVTHNCIFECKLEQQGGLIKKNVLFVILKIECIIIIVCLVTRELGSKN